MLLTRRSLLLRRGMTLVELLIVIVILTTIVGAAIPLMSPSNDDRRLREAARTLNTYITGAQTRAIASNRPYGIALKRLSKETKRAEDNGACLEVFYVEQPQAFAGFDANSRASVALHPTRPGYALVRFLTRVSGTTTTTGLPAGWDIDSFPNGIIRPGDVISINGTRFELLDDSASPDPFTNINVVNVDTPPNKLTFFAQRRLTQPALILVRPLNDSGQQIIPKHDDKGFEIGTQAPPVPPPYWALPSPYKILRRPTPASDEPYQLPEGTAIDLRASGVGSDEFFYVPNIRDNDQDVVIMFAPEGRVSRVSFSTLPVDTSPEGTTEAFDQSVVDNLYLLVGRRENIAALAASTEDASLQSSGISLTDEDRTKLRAKLNWLGGSSRWIVIGSQSGRVATIENASLDMAGLFSKYTNSPFNLVPGSEELRNQQILAAREFTREMAQLSGR